MLYCIAHGKPHTADEPEAGLALAMPFPIAYLVIAGTWKLAAVLAPLGPLPRWPPANAEIWDNLGERDPIPGMCIPGMCSSMFEHIASTMRRL